MNDDNLLKEIQEDYKKAQSKPKKKRKTQAEMELERLDRIRTIKRNILIVFVLIVTAVTGVAYAAERYVDWRAEHEWQFPLVWRGLVREIGETVTPVVEAKEQSEPEAEAEAEEKQSWTGKVSYYANGDGCLGCDPDEIMANGQKFDDKAMTLAFNHLPMNTKVRIYNLDNGANTIATVTDTGGFESYGRIADLSKGLMTELNAITDVSNIKIEVL